MGTRTSNDRGAALVVALGVLAFLIILSATFWQATRREMQTATNTADSIRAELLTDGAFAIAIAFLNHDLAAHPSYTSLDHAWRSYFNGAWAVGKPWLWAPILNEQNPGEPQPIALFSSNGISPDPNAIPPILRTFPNHFDPETLRPVPGIPEIPAQDTLGLTRGDANYFGEAIYIPRFVLDPNESIFNLNLRDELDADEDLDVTESLFPFVTTADLGDSPLADGQALSNGFSLGATVFPAFMSQRFDLLLQRDDANPITNDVILPAEQIHFWTDVDNDGDGLNDSIWIPIGGDVIFDADGIDNDLDGFIDELGETAVFLYDGTADGLDNNGDGVPDDPDERFVFLTTRIFNFIDGNVNDLISLTAINTFAISPERREELDLPAISVPNEFFDAVDVIDNNFDLKVNGVETFVVGPFDLDENHPALGYHQIDPRYLTTTDFVSSTGETVSEIVGRVAILITDEASKVNINTAGGHSYITNKTYINGDGDLVDAAGAPLTRAFGTGMGPAEFEPRILLQIGAARANRMWTFRMGATVDTDSPPHPLSLNPGDALSSAGYTDALLPFDFVDLSTIPPTNLTATLNFNSFEPFANDISLPGYGFVDDNGNALALALNGIDDDGDAEYYQNDGIDNDLNGIIDDEGEGIDEGLFPYDFDGDGFLDGLPGLEGIDEPQEFQPFRPLRNRVAESDRDFDDGLDGDFDGFVDGTDPEDDDGDNDQDGIFDEIGELGDRFYRTHEQLKILDEIGEVRFNNIRNFVTVHSQDRNDRHSHRDDLGDFSDDRLRTSTGPRLDYNVARAEEIARALRADWRYPFSEPLIVNDDAGIADETFSNPQVRAYALGLRREDTTVSTRGRLLLLKATIDESIVLKADAGLRAGQLGVSIKDFADRDFARSELTSKVKDSWWAAAAFEELDSSDPLLAAAAAGAQEQLISYTVAGIESIRINEIMVRPVRRFEAEAITDPNDVDFVTALNPNRFTPDLEGDFRMRVQTTLNRLSDPDFTGFAIINQVYTEFSGVPGWFRDVPGVTVPSVPLRETPGLPLMGLASAYTTYQSYFTVTTTIPGDNRVFDVPDVVQFSFQATDGLPAGRYYLKVNTEYIDGFVDANDVLRPVVTPSATREGDLNFIFKLGTLEDDILGDIIQTGFDEFGNPGIVVVDTGAWRAPAIIGSELLGGSTGTAFLQASNVYDVYSGPVVSGGPSDDLKFGAVTGFTIEVPGVDDDVMTEDLWLHVGVRSTRGDGLPLVLNYFDFSQEPDHEWVELVNVDTDTAVDVSGWELAVEGPDRLIMTIPPSTFIAPGGMLLLGTNKFDFFEVFGDPDDRGAFFQNGIGLASTTFDPQPGADNSFAGVTVPRTRTLSANGSVFIRDDSLDFIDRNGDGIADLQPTLDDAVVSTFDPITASTDPDKPWDRIVELVVPTLLPRRTGDPPEIRPLDAAAADVGAIVLAGGIFPNRPEYDGVDNDLDNRILSSDLIDNDGDGIIVDFDLIDNNGDGITDEVGEGIDDFLVGLDGLPNTADDILLEGIDEGRFRRDQFNQDFVPVPGGFNRFPPDFSSAFFTFVFPNKPYALPNANAESHRWKEFVERRNFPGDNVIVTLYEGPALRGRVVDRVTYNQRDVENSAIDDVIRTTFGQLEVGVEGFITSAVDGTETIPEPLHENFTSFWPGNTMGVDFYRSLERKHPLYSGDRFGTQNRFTATDGNYDDWADATGRWERVVALSPAGTDLPLQVTGLLDRFAAAGFIYDQFAHAFHGSPLRMNATQRYVEDIFLQGRLDRVRPAMFKTADLRNRNIVSAGDLLTMPHASKTNLLVTWQQFDAEGLGASAFLLDVDSPNFSLTNDPITFPPPTQLRQSGSYDQILLGQSFDFNDPEDFFQDIRAVIGNAAANSSLALSVGQAEVFQLAPGTVQWGTTPPLVGTTPTGMPEAWVPVLLHDLIDDGPGSFVFGRYQRRYLMERPFTLPNSVRNDRWPLESREVFYVSGNNQGVDTVSSFLSTDIHGPGVAAESLFVWDGDDGLENGEYILYLVMGDDLRTLLNAHNTAFAAFGTGVLTEGSVVDDSDDDEVFFGVDFVQKAIKTTFEERIVDVEVFTDKNGDRRVWTDETPFDGLPDTGELNDGGNGVGSETFGLEAGLEPDASGVIRYGVVRIENNYLAVMLRNWSDAGNVNMFSRVILAPRDRTPGRININTVQTRRINNTNLNPGLFNPLVGLPGILERVADSASLGPTGRFSVLPPGFLITGVREFVYADANLDEAQDLARQIVEQRQRSSVESPDGRYYELTSDLLADAHGLFLGDFLQPPLVIANHQELVGPGVVDQFSNEIDTTTNDREWSFKESAFRFSRMQNLITTRSDVFEIIVTVQAGYGTDTNGDGRINYRDDREFTATAEKSARTVYER